MFDKKREDRINEIQQEIERRQQELESLQTGIPARVLDCIASWGMRECVFQSYAVSVKKISDHWYICVPLPEANTEWTVSAYKWVIDLLTHKENYMSFWVDHSVRELLGRYIYIHVCEDVYE